jgi:ATP-dependent DNA helicase RecG
MVVASAADTTSPEKARGAPRADAPARAFADARALCRGELAVAPLHWPRPSRLREPLRAPTAKTEAALEALGLRTVGDLLDHLPRDSRRVRTISTLRPGEQATIAVTVRTIGARPVRRRGMRPLVHALVFDATGSARAMFFNQPWLAERYRPGTSLLLHGSVAPRGGFRVSHHAVGADPGQTGAVAHYPASEGVTSTQLLALVQDARRALGDVVEALPARLRRVEGLPDRASALAAMHFPQDRADVQQGRRRLAFEELLLAQLVFLRRRAERRARRGAPTLDRPGSLSERWLERELPFALTADQREAIETVRADLGCQQAMQRLLMGEVGSGKTVVALYAMLRAVEHGWQAALMAPTETLAEQHFATLSRLLGAEPVACALLTGSTPARRRRDVLGKLDSGELSLVVGTHALIEPAVRFRALGLAVIDEQHRFGVRQRAALDAKGVPHVLHMTATPIPRTLALAHYGDLETTTLRELPRGRHRVRTWVVGDARGRERAYAQLREQLRAGRQAYVVCPLVDEPDEQHLAERDDATIKAATAELARLREGELAGYELVLLHGGMSAPHKQAAMAAFASGRASVLVATTVVEVGIDVPNATAMLIENAERFGISQLHQLRGRVGRGEHRASCWLVGARAASRSAKLRAVAAHHDGFALAEIDLALRKQGELVGVRQSGAAQFRVACLPDDAALLERARARAEDILAEDPALERPEHALLADALVQRFGGEALRPIPA